MMTMTTRLARTFAGARAVISFVAAIAVLAVAPAAALAQEFQKVEGKLADDVPAVPFVGIAYGFIWLAVLVYVFVLGRGLGRVKTEIEDLRRRLDGAGAPRK
jgi:CcmD family protein